MPLTRYERRRSLVGVIAAMSVVNLVYGITFPLLALVLDQQGVSKTLIGLSTMAQAAAVLAIAPWAPGWLHRIAPSRLMQAMAAILALLFLVAGLYPNVWFWFPLRFVIGALTALLWISSEALINELAEEQWRGRIVGLYTSVGAAGFAMGPLLLIITGSTGLLPFVTTSLLILCASLPLFLVFHRRLERHEEHATGLWRVFWLAPAIMLANVVYAATAESMLTFFPLFGLSLGLSEDFALWLMTVMGIGTMLLVAPIGWVADKVDRMGLMAACVFLTMAGLLIMPWIIREPLPGAVFALLFGGVEGMIYALGVMLVGERFKGPLLAAATTLFTACWGLGTVLGPLIAGVFMDRFGAERLALIVCAFFMLYLPLPVVAYLRKKLE